MFPERYFINGPCLSAPFKYGSNIASKTNRSRPSPCGRNSTDGSSPHICHSRMRCNCFCSSTMLVFQCCCPEYLATSRRRQPLLGRAWRNSAASALFSLRRSRSMQSVTPQAQCIATRNNRASWSHKYLFET